MRLRTKSNIFDWKTRGEKMNIDDWICKFKASFDTYTKKMKPWRLHNMLENETYKRTRKQAEVNFTIRRTVKH